MKGVKKYKTFQEAEFNKYVFKSKDDIDTLKNKNG